MADNTRTLIPFTRGRAALARRPHLDK